MNKQGPNGIEWTDYTWNPVGGCKHACRWDMPDGTTAVCYAETVAERVAQAAYPHGFAHHYWNPDRLNEPLKVKKPARIFIDSMSDLMGHWVPDEQIEAVLGVCRQAHWHTFQLLTKNAPRLLKFEFPPNVWVGVSAPPTHMMGKPLTHEQQWRMVERQMDVFSKYELGNPTVLWMSIEPLSFDIARVLDFSSLDWIVIGAASNGARTYQPDPAWVSNVLASADCWRVPVFFKGNLHGNEAATPWREEFPS